MTPEVVKYLSVSVLYLAAAFATEKDARTGVVLGFFATISTAIMFLC